MADKNTQVNTTTQIRNLYSEGMSYMNIKFYNANLGFTFYPFIGRDNVGRSNYDRENTISTTVNFEGAFGLWQIADAIIDGRIKEITHVVPCAAGANLTLQAKTGMNGEPEVIFSISKNNTTIPFKFSVVSNNIKNGMNQNEVYYVHTGLGAFMDTVKGYLNGINDGRHLDKLTDDYVKSITGNNNSQQNQNNQQNNQQNNNRNNNFRGNYNNNGNYKKGYNNNYKRPYNNNNNGFQNPPQNNAQDFSSYQIPN